MSRFIQTPPESNNGKEKKPVSKPKPGTYTSDDLEKAQKIPTQGGYK